MRTVSGANEHLEGIDDGAVERPDQQGTGAGPRPLHGEAQPIVLVLHHKQRSILARKEHSDAKSCI